MPPLLQLPRPLLQLQLSAVVHWYNNNTCGHGQREGVGGRGVRREGGEGVRREGGEGVRWEGGVGGRVGEEGKRALQWNLQ